MQEVTDMEYHHRGGKSNQLLRTLRNQALNINTEGQEKPTILVATLELKKNSLYWLKNFHISILCSQMEGK